MIFMVILQMNFPNITQYSVAKTTPEKAI